MGPVPLSSLSHSSHSHLHNSSSGSSSGRNNPPPHIIPSSLLDSGASSSLTVRYGGGSSGPSSLPLSIDFTNSSVTNFPGYLNMNLNNGPPQSLDCTQTGSLNMPLVMGGITSGGASAFNMNLNLSGLPPHHLSSSLLNSAPGPGIIGPSSLLNSSQNMQSSSGYPPPPSQFLGNLLPSFSSVNPGQSTLGYGSSNSGGGGPRGGSESGSSASSADLGISNSASGKSNNLLLSLSSRGGRQGTLNSSEEDRDDSPMVCVQQSPVAASH